MTFRAGLIVLVAAVAILGGIASRTVLVVSSGPAAAHVPGCGFRLAISPVVSDTSLAVRDATSYLDPRSVAAAKTPLDADLQNALDQFNSPSDWDYRYPAGWDSFHLAYAAVWHHLRQVGYWQERAWTDLSKLKDYAADQRQANSEASMATRSMVVLERAYRAVC